MVTPDQVRAMVAGFPGLEDRSGEDRLALEVGGKGFAWTLMERTAPKKPRVPMLDVLAVRCDIARKEMLIEAAPDTFFSTDHYRGYPAVLVRLEAVEADELAGLLADAWAIQAPARLKKFGGVVGTGAAPTSSEDSQGR
jgi:hypothetical protein